MSFSSNSYSYFNAYAMLALLPISYRAHQWAKPQEETFKAEHLLHAVECFWKKYIKYKNENFCFELSTCIPVSLTSYYVAYCIATIALSMTHNWHVSLLTLALLMLTFHLEVRLCSLSKSIKNLCSRFVSLCCFTYQITCVNTAFRHSSVPLLLLV